jgi:hypothetical protein
MAFWDDLSCGPIDPDDLAVRTAWWTPFEGVPEEVSKNQSFWDRVETTEDRLIVWFGRHSSMELAFFLYWAERLGGRSFDVVDVTGRQLPFIKRDGSLALTPPAQAVGVVAQDGLKSLLGCERPFAAQEAEEARKRWHQLKRENALFRVATTAGLFSAPVDHFDSLVLEQTTAEWQSVRRIVGNAMTHGIEDYIQVGDMMLLKRVLSLIGDGKLLVEGDQRDIWSCRLRMPN